MEVVPRVGLEELVEFVLLVYSVIMAIGAIKSDSLPRAVFFFVGMSIGLAAIFYMLSAHIAAVIQLFFYAGLIPVLLVAILSLTLGRENEEVSTDERKNEE